MVAQMLFIISKVSGDWLLTFRILLFLASAIMMSPNGVIDMSLGNESIALLAAPPSPPNFDTPFPATVVMIPIEFTCFNNTN